MGDMADFYSPGGWCEDYDEDEKYFYFNQHIDDEDERVVELARNIEFEEDSQRQPLVKGIIEYYGKHKKLSYKQKSVLVNANFYYYEFKKGVSDD